MIKRALAILVLVLVPLQAIAGPMEVALDAFDRAEFEKAFKLMQVLAVRGYPEAQYQLGWFYDTGAGNRRVDDVVDKDDTKALNWYRKAAAQGHAVAHAAMGTAFATGRMAAKDPEKAAAWYRKAAAKLVPLAERGDARAQYELYRLYWRGDGVEKDLAAGAQMLRAAAEQGHVVAQYSLAVSHNAGVDVPEDIVQAYKWYGIVLRSTRSPDSLEMRSAKLSRQIMQHFMTPYQVAEGNGLVEKWLAKRRRQKN